MTCVPLEYEFQGGVNSPSCPDEVTFATVVEQSDQDIFASSCDLFLNEVCFVLRLKLKMRTINTN